MKLTLNKVIVASTALKNTPFKGTGVIDAAINLARLSEPLKIIDSVREQLLNKHNDGSNKFENPDSPKLAAFLEEFNAVVEKQQEDVELKVISIDQVDSARATNQESLAELIQLSIVKI